MRLLEISQKIEICLFYDSRRNAEQFTNDEMAAACFFVLHATCKSQYTVYGDLIK
jgi:hypothetical protein